MPCREAWCCKREDRNSLIPIPRQIYNIIKTKMKAQIAVLNQQPQILWRYSSWQLRLDNSFTRMILLHQPKKVRQGGSYISSDWKEEITFFFPPDFLPTNNILKTNSFRVWLSLGYSWLPNNNNKKTQHTPPQKKNPTQNKTPHPPNNDKKSQTREAFIWRNIYIHTHNGIHIGHVPWV